MRGPLMGELPGRWQRGKRGEPKPVAATVVRSTRVTPSRFRSRFGTPAVAATYRTGRG
jgi:hypothetical protein